jgi:hypothetical protein
LEDLLLRYGVQKALIDLDSIFNFCEDKLNLLSAAVSTLMPVKLGVGALCCKEANLLTADAVIKFMMETVGNQNSEMATELHTVSKLRIS